MRRVLIAGGRGFFGATIASLLRAPDIDPLIAGRAAPLALDVEDAGSLERVLRRGDVVVDAAGPFQARATTLIEVAMRLGVDVVDINESLPYARRVEGLAPRIAASGIAVLTSCSAVAAVAASLVHASRVAAPIRVSALVAPASRETAHAGTLRALLASVGTPIEVRRDGAMVRVTGWRERRRFALPSREAHVVESALAIALPAIWTSLRTADTWTDTSTIGGNVILSLVARAPALRAAAVRLVPLGALLARVAGTRRGGFAIEVEGADRAVTRLALLSERGSYRIAAAPAVLAARALAEDSFAERGLVPANRHAAPEAIFAFLAERGIELRRSWAPRP